MTGVELFTIGTTAISLADAFAAVGTVVGAVGAISSATAQANQAEFQSDVASQQAAQERTASRQEEEDFRREQSRLFARRRAVMGASGVETSVGSPLLASEDFASETELQARRIRAGGELRATRLGQQASLYGSQASSARAGGFTRAGSLLLSGAGNIWGRKEAAAVG